MSYNLQCLFTKHIAFLQFTRDRSQHNSSFYCSQTCKQLFCTIFMQYLSATERIVLVSFSFSITGGIALFSYASCNERGSKERNRVHGMCVSGVMNDINDCRMLMVSDFDHRHTSEKLQYFLPESYKGSFKV